MPVPKSKVGYIRLENPKENIIYVDETTKNDFNAYVEACAAKGFSTILSRGDGFYHATNDDGYRLSLEYEEDDGMVIEIREPAYLVKIELDCVPNLLFSRYDMKVYVDGDLIGTLGHGKKDIFEAELEKGTHLLKVTKEDDSSVDGTVKFEMTESIKVSYKLHCNSSGIDIEGGDVEILTPLGENQARMPASSEDYLNKAYAEVLAELEKAGFTNISTKVIEDLTEDRSDQDGTIKEILIGDKTQFQKADIFEKDIEIVITYHGMEPKPEEAEEPVAETPEPEEGTVEKPEEVEEPQVFAEEQLEPYVGKTVTELMPFLEEIGYTATYTAGNKGDDFTEWIQNDPEVREGFVVTSFQDINENEHTVHVVILGKDTIAEQEMQKALEEKLDEYIAWEAVQWYGGKIYPSFKLHYIIGKLEARAEDENTWYLKAYCDMKINGGKLKNLTCEARVTGTDENPQVVDFSVY